MAFLTSEIFRIVTEKNALRRSSGLPLLDVRAEIEKERYRLELAHYYEGFELYKPVFEDIKDKTLSELRLEYGDDFGHTWAERHLLFKQARSIYKGFLLTKGYRLPNNNPNPTITYGEQKPATDNRVDDEADDR